MAIKLSPFVKFGKKYEQHATTDFARTDLNPLSLRQQKPSPALPAAIRKGMLRWIFHHRARRFFFTLAFRSSSEAFLA